MASYENLPDPLHGLSPESLNELEAFAQDGGPDLSDLRGVSKLNGAQNPKLSFDADTRNPSTLFLECQTSLPTGPWQLKRTQVNCSNI